MKTNYKLPQYTPDAKKRIIAHGHKHINNFIDKINEHFVVSVLEERFGTPDGFRPNNPTSLNRHKTSFLAIFRNKTAKEISDDKDTWTSFGLLWFAYGLSLFDLKPQQIINRIKQNPENFFNLFLDTNINQSDLRQFYEYSFLGYYN